MLQLFFPHKGRRLLRSMHSAAAPVGCAGPILVGGRLPMQQAALRVTLTGRVAALLSRCPPLLSAY